MHPPETPRMSDGMDKCKSLYIIDKAADFCEQKQILPPPPPKKRKIILIALLF